jgi:hypothetical protein
MILAGFIFPAPKRGDTPVTQVIQTMHDLMVSVKLVQNISFIYESAHYEDKTE